MGKREVAVMEQAWVTMDGEALASESLIEGGIGEGDLEGEDPPVERESEEWVRGGEGGLEEVEKRMSPQSLATKVPGCMRNGA